MKRAPWLLVIAACARHDGGTPTGSAAPTGSATATARAIAPSDAAPVAAIALPPAPPVPLPPLGLPALPDSAALAVVTPDQVALGELLFWDGRLSTTGTVSCAGCHDPAAGYSGGIAATAAGERNLRRTQALANLAWASEFGWDGRFTSLEELLRAHVTGQLGAPLDAAIAKLAPLPLYAAHLARVGGPPGEAALRALEAYALTRYDGAAPWDRMERGGDPSPAVKRGYALFMGKAQCAACHTPPLYTDGGYHAVAPLGGDVGRGAIDHRAGAFQTPSLRGAALRTAFFHDGSIATLEAAIDAHAGSDAALARAPLSADERADLAAFVRTLSAPATAPAKPALPQ